MAEAKEYVALSAGDVQVDSMCGGSPMFVGLGYDLEVLKPNYCFAGSLSLLSLNTINGSKSGFFGTFELPFFFQYALFNRFCAFLLSGAAVALQEQYVAG